MFLNKAISKAFNCEFFLERSEENFQTATFIFLANGFSIPKVDEISNIFNEVNSNDKIELQLTLSNTNPIIFQSSRNIFQDFVSEIEEKIKFYTKGEKVELQLIFIKKSVEIYIYSIDAFITYIKGLTIEQLLINFSSKLLENSKLIFYCFDLKNSIQTKTICFINTRMNMNLTDIVINREELLTKIHTNCSFTFAKPIILIPEDFLIIDGFNSNKEIKEIFEMILSALLLTALFDITILKNNSITCKLNGYKSISNNFEILRPLNSIEEYYNIYKWVYTEGNLTDKIGLARNIISLHLNNDEIFEISNNTYVSIISAYKVYEKQNIKQYIELRNKISDQILSFNEKANSIIQNFASGFQKSALAFITLFSTIVITKVLTSHDFKNIFTFDATIISLLFLSGSLIYFVVLLWEVNAQLTRFKKSYSSMKKRNKDLLTMDDIERILNYDDEHKLDIQFIKEKRKNYSFLWISFLTLFFITTMFLHWTFSQSNPNDYSIYHIFNSTK